MNTRLTRRTVIGLLPVFARMASAAAIAPAQAPASWNAYATLLHNMIQVWLADNSDAALRLDSYFEGMRSHEPGGRLSLPIEIWISDKGRVADLHFPMFAHEQANADMQAVFRGRELPEPPPADMAQPVRLKLTITPRSPDSRGGAD